MVDSPASFAVRLVQCVVSTLTLGLLFASFQVLSTAYDYDANDFVNNGARSSTTKDPAAFHGQVATPTTNFIVLLSFSSTLFALWHVVAIDLARWVRRMAPKAEAAIDGLFVVCFVGGGIAFTLLPLVKDCNWFEPTEKAQVGSVHCTPLVASVVACFVTLAAYVASFAWNLHRSWVAHRLEHDPTKADYAAGLGTPVVAQSCREVSV